MEAGEGGGDTTVHQPQGVHGHQREGPDAVPVEAEPTEQQRRECQDDEHRGELGKPVEPDANRELRRRGSQRSEGRPAISH